MSVIKLKPNLCTTYVELCKNFGRRDGGQAQIPDSVEH